MPQHMRIAFISPKKWECRECGAQGSFTELEKADDCTRSIAARIGMEECPSCAGTGALSRALLYGDAGQLGNCECPTCSGTGVVSVAKADGIRRFNQQKS
jgi:DnaJ-class molecular chaperone